MQNCQFFHWNIIRGGFMGRYSLEFRPIILYMSINMYIILIANVICLHNSQSQNLLFLFCRLPSIFHLIIPVYIYMLPLYFMVLNLDVQYQENVYTLHQSSLVQLYTWLNSIQLFLNLWLNQINLFLLLTMLRCRYVFWWLCFIWRKQVVGDSWLTWYYSHGWVYGQLRKYFLGLFIKFVCLYDFYCIILICLSLNTMVHNWKLSCSYFLSNII